MQSFSFSSQTIPVFASLNPNALLSDSSGVAVIPYTTELDRQAIEDIALLHGVECSPAEQCIDGHSTTTHTLGPGTVISFGSDASEVARLYAHLTGRSHSTVWTLDALKDCEEIAVVITLASHLHSDLLSCLFVDISSKQGWSPGLIFAATPEALSRTAKLKAVSALACKRITRKASPRERILIFPWRSIEKISRSGFTILGGLAGTDLLRSKLGSKADLLFFSSHADGFDLILSNQSYRFLCPFTNHKQINDPAAPHCLQVDQCLRLPTRTRRTEAAERRHLIAPAAIRARVLVIFACRTIRTADGVTDAAYGLGTSLAEEATTGTILTTWRIERDRADQTTCNLLLNQLSAGASVGHAVSTFNHSQSAAVAGVKFCILGDPTYSLDPTENPITLPSASQLLKHEEGPPLSAELDALFSKCSFWRVFIASAKQRSRLLRQDDAVRADLAFSGLALALLRRANRSTLENLRREAQDRFLRFIAPDPKLEGFLNGINDSYCLTEDGRCPSCGSRCRVFRQSVGLKGVADYECWDCPSCGESRSAVASESASLDAKELASGRLSFANPPRSTNSLVLVALFNQDPLYHSVFEWCDPSRAKEIELPDRLPAGQLFGRVLFAHNLEFACLGFKFRFDKTSRQYHFASRAESGRDSG